MMVLIIYIGLRAFLAWRLKTEPFGTLDMTLLQCNLYPEALLI